MSKERPETSRASSLKSQGAERDRFGTIRRLRLSDHECNHFGKLVCPSSGTGGSLSSADCRLDDGSYIDLWQFNGTAGETVTIEMSSALFDTYLFLLDPTPTVVAQNDDIESGITNSRIVFTLTASGTWTVGATSLAPNQFGDYSLTLQCESGPPPATPTPTATSTPVVPTATPIPGPCVVDATTLCLNNGRFRVQAIFA
ncbi:MAG TPA: PPC domain-containing protein, partial [Thermoanaerobaculia bacterium]|nr:PPC domain-containing protein [Thermoanaerobaculia bacterium]